MTSKIVVGLSGTGGFECRNTSGTLFDPTTVSLWIKPPTSSEVAVTASTSATGVYTFTYTPAEPGIHTARMEGVTGGSVVCRGRGAFYVSPDSF